MIIKQCDKYHEFVVKRYSTHINGWFDHCTRQNIDPFDASVNQGAEFLNEYFLEGTNLSMVNTTRLALFSVFLVVNGKSLANIPSL